MICPNCACKEFLDDALGSNNKWIVGRKYICRKCGFKGSKEMMKAGMIKKRIVK
jgi:acetone carboxylase gamma subunit